MVRRVYVSFALVAAGMAILAGSAIAASNQRPVYAVVDVNDPLDQRMYDYMTAAVRDDTADVVIFQIDSPGMASGDPSELFAAIRSVDRPVLAWVGPAPAVAHGGVASILNLSDVSGAAPGAQVGYLDPAVVAGDVEPPFRSDHGGPQEANASRERLRSTSVEVREPVAGYVDVVTPTIGQFIVGLDGIQILKNGATHVLDTAAVESTDAGEVTVAAVDVRFSKPGLWDRFLRLGARPETAFFFLIAGIAVATFEFYAAGVGVSAAVAVVALFLAGYAMAILPMRWWAVVVTLVGLFLYTWEFQRNQLGWRSVVGTAALIVGGVFFVDATPQFGPVPWLVLVIVAGTGLFYGVALTTIARSRFSTLTIGREGLIGKVGTAETDLTPDGIVSVDGARWRSRSHRAAGIVAGDAVEVLSIDGIVLEVGPTVDHDVRG